MNVHLISIELEQAELKKALIISIATLAGVTLLFLALTLAKKGIKVNKARKKAQYQKQADNLLFNLLFLETDLNTVLQEYQRIKTESSLFKKVMIKSIIALHNNYTGIHKIKLEEFYVRSGIVDYSINKINSNKTVKIIEGLRDLSCLNYQPVYKKAIRLLTHKNDLIKREALTALVVLKGTSELLKLVNINFYVDDWTQSNIIFAIKKKADHAPQHIHLLLKSKNESMVLLGARLIEYFQLSQHINEMEKVSNCFYSFRNKEKMKTILKRLNKFSYA